MSPAVLHRQITSHFFDKYNFEQKKQKFCSEIEIFRKTIDFFNKNRNFGRECKYLHFVKNCRSTFRRQCNNAEHSVP